ncbi:MAG: hypothetical protein IBX63_10365 [Coriobacteriia bacterium]|nr:hypothetical protein [Coriobacteriia bacterium]
MNTFIVELYDGANAKKVTGVVEEFISDTQSGTINGYAPYNGWYYLHMYTSATARVTVTQ